MVRVLYYSFKAVVSLLEVSLDCLSDERCGGFKSGKCQEMEGYKKDFLKLFCATLVAKERRVTP